MKFVLRNRIDSVSPHMCGLDSLAWPNLHCISNPLEQAVEHRYYHIDLPTDHSRFTALWLPNVVDSEIAELAAKARKTFEDDDLGLVNIADSLPKDREKMIAQLITQVETLLKKGDVSESSKLLVLSKANDLLGLGRTVEASTIRQRLDLATRNVATSEFEAELAKFDRRVKLFQLPFDISGITDFQSKPVTFKVANAKFRILYFGSVSKKSDSILVFNELERAVQRELLNSNLEFVVVYMDQDDNLEALRDIKTFAEISVHWQVWQLKAATKEGQALLDRVPIDESPYIVLLDKDDHVVALNPSIVVIEEFIFAK